jgi:Rrf2 family iron-sulfur cluster assembly transcriptional regulator
MRITALESYGLRCLLALARKGPEGQLTIPDIARAEGLSIPYTSKLLSILRKSGLITSVRGRGGGFCIARPPDQITLNDVLTALGGPLIEPDHCSRHSGQLEECVRAERCSIHDLLGDLASYVSSFLTQTTLQSILDNEHSLELKPLEKRLRPAADSQGKQEQEVAPSDRNSDAMKLRN